MTTLLKNNDRGENNINYNDNRDDMNACNNRDNRDL